MQIHLEQLMPDYAFVIGYQKHRSNGFCRNGKAGYNEVSYVPVEKMEEYELEDDAIRKQHTYI